VKTNFFINSDQIWFWS